MFSQQEEFPYWQPELRIILTFPPQAVCSSEDEKSNMRWKGVNWNNLTNNEQTTSFNVTVWQSLTSDSDNKPTHRYWFPRFFFPGIVLLLLCSYLLCFYDLRVDHKGSPVKHECSRYSTDYTKEEKYESSQTAEIWRCRFEGQTNSLHQFFIGSC